MIVVKELLISLILELTPGLSLVPFERVSRTTRPPLTVLVCDPAFRLAVTTYVAPAADFCVSVCFTPIVPSPIAVTFRPLPLLPAHEATVRAELLLSLIQLVRPKS